jgi:hypothetical protein
MEMTWALGIDLAGRFGWPGDQEDRQQVCDVYGSMWETSDERACSNLLFPPQPCIWPHRYDGTLFCCTPIRKGMVDGKIREALQVFLVAGATTLLWWYCAQRLFEVFHFEVPHSLVRAGIFDWRTTITASS